MRPFAPLTAQKLDFSFGIDKKRQRADSQLHLHCVEGYVGSQPLGTVFVLLHIDTGEKTRSLETSGSVCFEGSLRGGLTGRECRVFRFFFWRETKLLWLWRHLARSFADLSCVAKEATSALAGATPSHPKGFARTRITALDIYIIASGRERKFKFRFFIRAMEETATRISLPPTHAVSRERNTTQQHSSSINLRAIPLLI